MDLGGSLGHLTYSTLVHPVDTWEEMWHSLTTYVPAVKERARLKAFLADNDMYLYTVNAFPHGQFKGVRVKEQVYEPDWRTDQRALYTMQVADILAEVVPAGIAPSIQSPPCGFKPRVTGPDVVDAYTRQVQGRRAPGQARGAHGKNGHA